MRVIRSTSHASANARSDGGRRSQAWKPERETPSSLHNSEIEWLAFSAAMNRNRLTASRSPSRRRPRLFSRSPAPARATTPAGAVRAAPRARRRSGHRAHPARSALAAPTAAATPATHRDRRRSPQASDPFERRAPPLHAETPAGTAFGTSASLAWPDSLSAGPDNPALSCPRNRGHSNDHSRLAYCELLPSERKDACVALLERARSWYRAQGIVCERVLTDNAKAHHSHCWRGACAQLGIERRYTRPYSPWTNGKAEALIKTLLREWAYRFAYRTSAHRARALRLPKVVQPPSAAWFARSPTSDQPRLTPVWSVQLALLLGRYFLLLPLGRVRPGSRGAVELRAPVEALLRCLDVGGVADPSLERRRLQRAPIGERRLPGMRAERVHRIEVCRRILVRLTAGEKDDSRHGGGHGVLEALDRHLGDGSDVGSIGRLVA